jgi:tetratricopeptide (TPR) repeat protein
MILTAAVALGVQSQLPSFAAREYEHGMQAYREKDYHRAINALTDVIDQPSPPVVAYYFRGRAYLRLQPPDYARAAADFHRAADLAAADPQSKAGYGKAAACAAYAYCVLFEKDQGRAAEHAARARDFCQKSLDADFAKAIAFNNLAFVEAREASRCMEAMKLLDEALRLDKKLQAAYHQRARIFAQIVNTSYGRAKGFTPEQGIHDIEAAMDCGPVTPELLYDACCLYLPADNTRPVSQVRFRKAKDAVLLLVKQNWVTREMAQDFAAAGVWTRLGVVVPENEIRDRSDVPPTRLLVDPVNED